MSALGEINLEEVYQTKTQQLNAAQEELDGLNPLTTDEDTIHSLQMDIHRLQRELIPINNQRLLVLDLTEEPPEDRAFQIPGTEEIIPGQCFDVIEGGLRNVDGRYNEKGAILFIKAVHLNLLCTNVKYLREILDEAGASTQNPRDHWWQDGKSAKVLYECETRDNPDLIIYDITDQYNQTNLETLEAQQEAGIHHQYYLDFTNAIVNLEIAYVPIEGYGDSTYLSAQDVLKIIERVELLPPPEEMLRFTANIAELTSLNTKKILPIIKDIIQKVYTETLAIKNLLSADNVIFKNIEDALYSINALKEFIEHYSTDIAFAHTDDALAKHFVILQQTITEAIATYRDISLEDNQMTNYLDYIKSYFGVIKICLDIIKDYKNIIYWVESLQAIQETAYTDLGKLKLAQQNLILLLHFYWGIAYINAEELLEFSDIFADKKLQLESSTTQVIHNVFDSIRDYYMSQSISYDELYGESNLHGMLYDIISKCREALGLPTVKFNSTLDKELNIIIQRAEDVGTNLDSITTLLSIQVDLQHELNKMKERPLRAFKLVPAGSVRYTVSQSVYKTGQGGNYCQDNSDISYFKVEEFI